MTTPTTDNLHRPGQMKAIERFLSQNGIAFVGLSTHEEDFSRRVYEALLERDYRVVPVHPGVQRVAGQTAFERVQDVDVSYPVTAALVMVPAESAADVVQDCIDAGIKHVWLHKGAGAGAVSEEAIELCDLAAVDAVIGQCPMMFLSEPGLVHRAHAVAKKIHGTFPT